MSLYLNHVNQRRRAGKEDYKIVGLSEEQINALGDRSPRFVYTIWITTRSWSAVFFIVVYRASWVHFKSSTVAKNWPFASRTRRRAELLAVGSLGISPAWLVTRLRTILTLLLSPPIEGLLQRPEKGIHFSKSITASNITISSRGSVQHAIVDTSFWIFPQTPRHATLSPYDRFEVLYDSETGKSWLLTIYNMTECVRLDSGWLWGVDSQIKLSVEFASMQFLTDLG